MTRSLTEPREVSALDQALPGAIVAITFLVFAQTLAFDFVYDDRLQIVQNPSILSWSYLPQYFTSNVWSFRPGFVSNYYRPLFFVWFRLNEAVFGLQPAGWHLTSVLLHLLVTLEVYWAGEKLLRDRRAAAVGAALFGLHPIHVESVAWVSAVPDLHVAALTLASLLTYLRFRSDGPKRGLWFTASVGLYALATLTKETALIFPMIIFAYEWIWGQAKSDRLWQERLARFRASLLRSTPYLAVSVLYFVARIRALGTFSSAMANVPLRTIILTWPSLLWFYARKLVWPSGLSPFYDAPYVTKPGISSFLFPAAMVAVIVLLLCLWARRGGETAAPSEQVCESRVVAFAAVWLGLPFLALLNLSAFPLGEILKDRYLYVPSIGAAWLAAVGWRHIKGSLAGIKLSASAALASCLILGALSMRQSAYWANDLVLFTRAYAIAPRNSFALGNMALLAYQQGYPIAALKLFRQAVDADPTNERLYYNMAITEFALGETEDSDRDLSHALRLIPADPTALFALGKVRYSEGRIVDSLGLIRHALQIDPNARGYHSTMGAILEQTGDLQGSLHEFGMELAADPTSQESRQAILRVTRRAAATPHDGLSACCTSRP